MKKTLIALTLAALPVAASADVVLYGKIQGGVEVNRNFTKLEYADGTKAKQGTATKIVDYGSRIGFKGHEDLNNNLRAIWQVEQNVNIGGQNTGFSTRDSFIGLTGNFGTAKAGYLSTPVKDVNGRLDDWSYSDNAAGLGVYTRKTAARDRKVAASYETPNFGGFSAQAYVSPSDNNNGNSFSWDSNNKNAEKAVYGAKLGYENSGVFADVAGTYVKNAEVIKGFKKDGYQAVANVGYESDNWLAGVSYQQGRYVENLANLTDSSFGGDDEVVKRSQEVAATAAYTVNNSLRLKGSAAYGFGVKAMTANGMNHPDKIKYVQGVVGADYLLSKRTALNSQVGYLQFKDGEDKVKKGTVGVGMSHKF